MPSPSQGVDLSLQDLTRQFQKHKVLENFSLLVRAGEFVSLLGPSGCGKSTLLRLIAGLDEPSGGTVNLGKATKSFVFQDANLLPWRTLRRNLELVFELEKVAVDSGRVNEVLSLVGLLADANKYPNQLSGGMRMRASVARALLTRPQLLLLDEPFAALDENTRHRLQEELYRIWQQEKMTIIFVTHSASEAVFLSERAIVLGGQPTQLILDHRVALPSLRNGALRSDPAYISEMKLILKSFDR